MNMTEAVQEPLLARNLTMAKGTRPQPSQSFHQRSTTTVRRAVVPSKSMPPTPTEPSVAVETSKTADIEEAMAQSQRFLRVLLHDKTVTVNKASVDRGLQKYAQLLKQVQASAQPQQQLVILEQQRKQIVEQQQRIAALDSALERQQSIMTTAMEIKTVEFDICVRERDQKTQQVQQLQWKLAKERTASRDKASAQAAAVAASSSLTNRAQLAEQAVTQQQSQIQSLEQTVTALRAKDRVLQQLLARSCVLCQPAAETMTHLDEQQQARSSRDEMIGQEESAAAQLHRRLEKEQRELSSLFPLRVVVPVQPEEETDLEHNQDDLLEVTRHHKNSATTSSDSDEESSEATPVMGHSSHQYDNNDDLQTQPVKETVASSVPAAAADTVFDTTQRKLHQVRKQLLATTDAIATLEAEKTAMAEDLEETIGEREDQIKHLKGVLIACNERRKAAEEILHQAGLHDEEALSEITQKHPENLINEIVKKEIDVRISEDEAASKEIERLKQALAEMVQQKADAEKELAQLEAVGHGAYDKIVDLEEQLAETRGKLEAANAKHASMEREYADELQESREALNDATVTIQLLQQCINKSRELDGASNHAPTEATELDPILLQIMCTEDGSCNSENQGIEAIQVATDNEKPHTESEEQATTADNHEETEPKQPRGEPALPASNQKSSELERVQHELQQTRREVEELRRKLEVCEKRLTIADGKLVFLREMVQSVAPPAPIAERRGTVPDSTTE